MIYMVTKILLLEADHSQSHIIPYLVTLHQKRKGVLTGAMLTNFLFQIPMHGECKIRTLNITFNRQTDRQILSYLIQQETHFPISFNRRRTDTVVSLS